MLDQKELLIKTLQEKDAMFRDENNKEWLAKHDAEGLKQWLMLLNTLNLGQSPAALPRGKAPDTQQPVVQNKPLKIEVEPKKDKDEPRNENDGSGKYQITPGKEKLLLDNFAKTLQANNLVLGKDITLTRDEGGIRVAPHTPEARAALGKFNDQMVAQGVLQDMGNELQATTKQRKNTAPSPLRTTLTPDTK